MKPMLRCLVLPALGLALGWSLVAFGDEPGPATRAAMDPVTLAGLELLRGGGLPAVLALLGWWLRGISTNGMQITVKLHDDDRKLLEPRGSE